MEVEQQTESAPASRAKNVAEPAELDRQVRVSRNVEEHELENALRSLPQHGEKMKELLLRVFNLEDPETAASRILPRYWIRMHHEWRDCYFHPDDANSPVDGMLSDHLWGDWCTMFFDSSDPTMIDTGHQSEWADIEMPDGSVKKCEDPRSPTGHKWTGYTLFVPLAAGENAEQETEDRSALKPKPKMLKVPGEPSESERRLHELTHLPYRDWCEHSVRSKGRQSHAVKKKNDRQPVIQIDFSLMATENELPKRTVLNATDVQAVVLPSKGSVEKYGVAKLRKLVFEISRTFGIVQYDDEVVGKGGTKIDVEVSAEKGELDQEMRLSEPLRWESEFPPEAEKKGMMKEMNSMKNFDVCVMK